MKKLILLTLLLFVFSGLYPQTNTVMIKSSVNELPPLIDIETFFGDPEISGAQISPDGNYISFRKPYNGIMNIWVKKFDEPFENARPLTADTKRPLRNYFWSRDGKYILFIQDNGGDENFRLYAVDPKGGAEPSTGVPRAKDLTPQEKIRVYFLSVPRSSPDEVIVGINDRDPAYHDVYKIRISTGERTLIRKNEEKIGAFYADREGNLRLASKKTEDGGTEFLKFEGNSLKQIYYVNSLESAGIEGFSENPRYAYLSTNKGDDADLTKLMMLDTETGNTEFIESDPENEVDFEGIFYSEKKNKLIATFYAGDRIRIYFKDDEWKSAYESAKQQLPDGEVRFTSLSNDEMKILFYVGRDVDQGSIYVFDRNTGSVTLLYTANPNLPSEHLVPMIPVRYPARDGLSIPAYVMLPKGIEPKNLPTVIFPHGGPWARDYWGYNSFGQFLANRGYAVLIPNFRGSTGYGKKFLNAGNKEWGTGYMQHDLSDGVKYMIEKGYSDPKKVAIMGGSYGGYATLAGVAFTPELFAAGVSIVGPSNLLTLLKSIPPYWAPIKKMFDVRLGNPDNPDDVERLKEQSPLFSAQNITAPLLVIQGANDPRVKQAESDQIVATLRDLNRQVEYLLAPDEGHGFSGKLNRLAMIARIDMFLAKHLGGRHQEKFSNEIEHRLQELTVNINTVKLPEPVNKDSEGEFIIPNLNLDNVKNRKLSYEVTMKIGSRDFNFTAERDILVKDGKVLVSDKIISAMGSASDSYIINATTLLPEMRNSKQGDTETLSLIYSADKVMGKMQGMGNPVDINVKLTGPVLGEGASLELFLTALPLKDNYSLFLKYFEHYSQEVKSAMATVKGIEEITVPAGTFSCYKIELKSDIGTTDYYWISADNSPKIVKGEFQNPAIAGGGTTNIVLAKTE